LNNFELNFNFKILGAAGVVVGQPFDTVKVNDCDYMIVVVLNITFCGENFAKKLITREICLNDHLTGDYFWFFIFYNFL